MLVGVSTELLLNLLSGLIASVSIAFAVTAVVELFRRGVWVRRRVARGSEEVRKMTASDAELDRVVFRLLEDSDSALRSSRARRARPRRSAADDRRESSGSGGDSLSGGGGSAPPDDTTTASSGGDEDQPRPSRDLDPRDVHRALLETYHAQGLSQSRVMFAFSVTMASLGFATIVTAAIAMLTTSGGDVAAANVVALIAGVVVDAVSALFFVQNNRARALMAEFFNRLRADHSIERAIAVAEQISDPVIQSRTKAALALRLAEASNSDDVIQTILASPTAGAALRPLPARNQESDPPQGRGTGSDR